MEYQSYLQQLGRALSSDTLREKTIVFDLVNNYLKNNLDAEINRKRNNRNHRDNDDIDGGHEDGPQGDIEDLDIFRIQGETKDFLDLLNEVQGIIARSDYLTNARAIKAWIDTSEGTKPPTGNSRDENEKKLEQDYEQQLSIKQGELVEDTQKQGVDYNK